MLFSLTGRNGSFKYHEVCILIKPTRPLHSGKLPKQSCHISAILSVYQLGELMRHVIIIAS